jgi:hypothetical protein
VHIIPSEFCSQSVFSVNALLVFAENHEKEERRGLMITSVEKLWKSHKVSSSLKIAGRSTDAHSPSIPHI